MPWTKKADETPPFEHTGPQPAVLVNIIDIGTHTDTSPTYGEVRRQQVIFIWELNESRNDGAPLTVQAFYTLSLHEKANLRKMLEAWRGKPFSMGEDVDITATLGKPCMLNIGLTEGGRGKVLSVSRLPKGMDPFEHRSPLLIFRTDEPDWSVYEQLSEWHQNKIQTSEEWSGMKSHAEMQAAGADPRDRGPDAPEDFDDDIPF